ncbi:MAG: alpha-amylase family glycosyl hydrolase [Bryobacteraceae bacterium]|jgi:hypothetical protein
MRAKTFLLLFPLFAAGAFAQQAGEIRFGNSKIELRFDAATGRWLSLYDPASGAAVLEDSGLASVLVAAGGRTTVTSGRDHYWSIQDALTAGMGVRLAASRTEQEGDKRRLILETEEGDWKIVQQYELANGGDTVERTVSLTWNGPQETRLRWVDFRTPVSDARADNLLEAPGNPGILHQPLARLPLGQWPLLEDAVDREATLWRPGVLIFRYPRVNALLWTYSASIPEIPTVWRGDRGVWLNERLFASARMKKGQTLDVGAQYIRLAPGDYMEALGRFHGFWNEAGLRLAGETPSWARRARVYEVHLGQKSFPSGQPLEPYPNVAALTADLDRIAALGFNVVQLMPHFPFPSYAVHDYMDIAVQYAPEPELRRMIDRAHALGLKVFLDVVMHGVLDKTLRPNAIYDTHPWLKEHPDWFVYTEDGRVARTYTWSLDQSSPSFQDYMVGVFRYYVGTLGADGFRIDAEAWNFFPNWAVGLNRPAYASIWGCVPLFQRVRAETRKIKPDVVFYTESQGPLPHFSYDLSYDYDEHWLYQALLPLLTTRGYGVKPLGKTDARGLADWLEMRRLVLPDGLIRVHHLDSHDSYERPNRLEATPTGGGLGMYGKEAFGVEGARLLFAWAAFMDGGVMNYVWAEKGSEDFYRRVLALRESTPAMHDGSCDYLALRPSSNRVFAPLWRGGGNLAIPVLAFSDKPVQTQIPLDALKLDPDAQYTLREAFSSTTRTARGRELTQLSLDLPAYGVELWTITRAGLAQ